MPDMPLALRILDVSIGGCALWLPADVPPLQAGTELGELRLRARRRDAVRLRGHAAARVVVGRRRPQPCRRAGGKRVGCEWRPLGGHAERALQRWIDQAQKRRRRLLTLG